MADGSKLTAQIAPSLLGDEDLERVYNWVDEIPLSRPKRNICRDFSDGVLVAEVINYYFPRLVELHNFSQAHSAKEKQYNWDTLNNKVLKKMGYQIHQQDLDEIIRASPGAIERVLRVLQDKIVQVQKLGLPGKQLQGAVGGEVPVRGGTSDSGGREGYNRGGTSDSGGRYDGGGRQGGGNAAQNAEKDQTIKELREMVDILMKKVKALEQLVALKESKLEAMSVKLAKHGLS